MKNILKKLGYKYVCNAKDLFSKKNNRDLSLLNPYKEKKGVFVLTESDEIIYVGRTKDLKVRIAQCLGSENDTGSIANASKLSQIDIQRIIKSNVYVFCLDEDIKQDITVFNLFNKK